MNRLPWCLTALLSLLFYLQSPAQTNIDVTSSADSGAGTLREAIQLANNATGNELNIIRIQISSVQLLSTLPAIDSNVWILGSGTTSRDDANERGGSPSFIAGDGTFPLMTIAGGEVRLENLFLSDGFAKGGDGSFGNGGAPGGGGAGMGGAIFMSGGDVFMRNIQFTNNGVEGGLGYSRYRYEPPIPLDMQSGGGGGGTSGAGGVDGTGGDGGRGPTGQPGLPISCSASPTPPEAGGSGGDGSCADLEGRHGRDGSFGAGGGGGAGVGGNGGNGGFGGGGGGSAVDGIPGLAGEFGKDGFNTSTSGPGAGLGGALFVRGGTLKMENCFFFDSSATGGTQLGTGAKASGRGGAIFVHPGAEVFGSNILFSGSSTSDPLPPAGKSDYIPEIFNDNVNLYGIIKDGCISQIRCLMPRYLL